MKVIVIVKASKSSEAGALPSEQMLTEMGKFNEELVKAGVMVDGVGLKPSSAGARVHFSGTDRMEVDGPFAETKELVAGFWIWRVKSMREAIDWVKRCPNPMPEDSVIEIRPVFEADDFGEAFTPELREQEAALRAVGLGLNSPTFETKGDMQIAGISHSYTMETRVAIPGQWERFVDQAGTIPTPVGKDFYGVSWNSQPNCDFDYLTGVEISSAANLPPDFTSLKLEGRRYAVFTHTEHVSSIPQTIGTIWTKWAPDCGLKIAHAPCFERYTSEYNPTTGMGGMEIWIPLE